MATKLLTTPATDPLRRPDNLALLFQEMFTIIARLRTNRQRFGDLEVFRMQIRNTLKRVEHEGLQRGYETEDMRVAAFAVVAFLDESILDSGNPLFEDWSFQPLQLELFGVRVAGEIFYRNLERLLHPILRDRPDSANAADLLEVHQICLLLGFRGRYGSSRTSAEIAAILQRTEAKIQHIRGGSSPALWRPVPPAANDTAKAPLLRCLQVGRYLQSDWPRVPGFLLRRQNKQPDVETMTGIDSHFAKAAEQIQKTLGIKQLSRMHTVFMFGDIGAAKTSLIANAGIQAELLAGHGALVATRTLNLWHGWDALFVDPGGALLADPAARGKLIRKFAAHRTRSLVFAVDCGIFFQPGAAEALAAKLRHFRTMISELARHVTSSFPVYVVFTKADQIPYFSDFARNLNSGEAAEPLGVTLSLDQPIAAAFQDLYRFLAGECKTYLAREGDSEHLPGIYEFPREFAKLRPSLVQFLTGLYRRRELPFVLFPRGFYFSGVRQSAATSDAAAPQCLFLRRLFSEVILADHRPNPLITPRARVAAAG